RLGPGAPVRRAEREDHPDPVSRLARRGPRPPMVAAAFARPEGRMKKPISQRIAIGIGALILLLWTLTPFYWAMNMGLKWHTEVLDGSLVPRHPTLANVLRLVDIPVNMPDGTPAESFNSFS